MKDGGFLEGLLEMVMEVLSAIFWIPLFFLACC